jgi:hypothetical protein
MGCERLAHTVLRRDTLLKTSEHRWQSTECALSSTGHGVCDFGAARLVAYVRIWSDGDEP